MVEDGSTVSAVHMYAAAFAMVLAQCATVAAVQLGNMWQTCSTSDMCAQGQWCDSFANDRCVYCGTGLPLKLEVDAATGQTRNRPRDPNFAGFNFTYASEVCEEPSAGKGQLYLGEHGLTGAGKDLDQVLTFITTEWCDRCHNAETGSIDPLVEEDLIAAYLAAMGFFDWIAMFFASMFVALAVCGELRDIKVVIIAIEREEKVSTAWRYAILFLCWMRRYVFLPGLVATVEYLVFFKGADALSICFNTIAVLFSKCWQSLYCRVLVVNCHVHD